MLPRWFVSEDLGDVVYFMRRVSLVDSQYESSVILRGGATGVILERRRGAHAPAWRHYLYHIFARGMLLTRADVSNRVKPPICVECVDFGGAGGAGRGG